MKLKKVVTPKDFVYYVDNSLGNDGEDEYLPFNDSDHDGSEDEEVEFLSGLNNFVGFIQETNSDCVQFSSLVGGSEVAMQ